MVSWQKSPSGKGMKQIDLTIPQGAIFSEDGTHRYSLWRIWSQSKPFLMFCGLNPSKAGQINNDPTVTRMMSRSYKEGYGGLFVGNLYSYVSTDPKALIGNNGCFNQETDYYIKLMSELSERQLCGWGSFPAVKFRDCEVFKLMTEPYCLGVNGDGQPKHPLYIGYNVPMIKYKP